MAAFKDAFSGAIQAAGDRGDLSALSHLDHSGHEPLKAHPEAFVAWLETLARFPYTYRYIDIVRDTNELLEKEFNTDEKLNELFLRSKKGKEALVHQARKKTFPIINNWLARTKEILSNATPSNSGTAVDKCLRFLRLLSLKYSN